MSQLQQTLVSVQELLVQQQQKIQDLSQEMAAAEVAGITLATEHPNTTNTKILVNLVKYLLFYIFPAN